MEIIHGFTPFIAFHLCNTRESNFLYHTFQLIAQLITSIRQYPMFEDLVSNLLSTYLGDYLEGLTKDDLKISLWKGDVELRNLVMLFQLIHYREFEQRHLIFSIFLYK